MNGRRNLINNLLFGLGLALMIAALYMVFMYVPTEKSMGIVQRIFYFHVSLAWVSFLAFLVTFVFSICYLRKRLLKWDYIAHASAEVGVVFTTLVLITGPIWAKTAWGIWWTWDARLTTSLVLWLTYIAYLLVRGYATEPARGARFGAVVGIVGFIDVPIVFLTVNVWRTQHPTTIIFTDGITAPMLMTLVVCIAAFTVLYVLLTAQGAGLKSLETSIKRLKIRRTG
ncbi:MAG TPA: cytochrome c biogenesis protein CcsA [Dehalococcoidia bacterium]|nr:cytochrome c biogenesis protein CcsA [Dehalococcoidia bacterium]